MWAYLHKKGRTKRGGMAIFTQKCQNLRTLSLQNKNLYDLRVDLYDLRMKFQKKAVLLHAVLKN